MKEKMIYLISNDQVIHEDIVFFSHWEYPMLYISFDTFVIEIYSCVKIVRTKWGSLSNNNI